MEAGSLNQAAREGRAAGLAAQVGRSPALLGGAVLVAVVVALLIAEGAHDTGQATVNGLVAGSYFALGAVGLTFVYGILKLVNFAHGDFLTFGAYVAFAVNVSAGVPIVPAALVSVAATAALGMAFELILWRPMRARRAGVLQLILISIGLAFVLRNGIQMVAGTAPQNLDVDVTSALSFLGDLRIGTTQLIVALVAYAVLVLVGLMLRYTRLGKQMRALSDSVELAETTGIDTGRVIIITWLFAGGLAGLAGVLYAAGTGAFDPNFGFFLLLTLFAAVILGGIGNAYGALAGGIVLGLAQEWSTLVIDSRWKVAVGFGILVLVLVVRPQGIFGRARTL